MAGPDGEQYRTQCNVSDPFSPRPVRPRSRRSCRSTHGLERGVGEHDGRGEGVAVLVDHGEGFAGRERPISTRRVDVDFVEVDDPKAGQRGERFVARRAAGDTRVDADRGREPGVDRGS